MNAQSFLSPENALQKDSLSLALCGDAVWCLFVREKLIFSSDAKAGVISAKAVAFVCAKAQCQILYAIEDKLTEDEQGVVRRARNAHNPTKAKNSTVDEYKKATALEALLGFLYLTGQKQRLQEMLDLCYQVGAGIDRPQKGKYK
ncbi:MAG: ribonuclease III [Firmicutes bacterium]|nr:ribonuclease III [Bacillota bacterium]